MKSVKRKKFLLMIWMDSVNGWRKVEWVEKVEQGELFQVQQCSWYVVEEVELRR